MVRIAALLLVLVLAGSASAAATVYTDRASWEAAVTGSLYTETFESVPDQLVPAGATGAIHTPMFDIVHVPAFYAMTVADGIGAAGSRGFGSTVASYDTNPLSFDVLSFAQPIFAIAVDVVSAPHLFFLQLGPFTSLPPGDESGAVLPPGGFVGLISDTPFTTARFAGHTNDPPFSYQIDNVSLVVPEPGLGALVAIAALLAGWCRRVRVPD